MRTADALAHVESTAWAGAVPAVSVVLATHNRAGYLSELGKALEALQPPPGGFEVLIADDGSTDDTWPVLQQLASTSRMAFLALRLAPSGGPSVPRNTASVQARGRLLAFTDDDCLPEPSWLVRLAAGAEGTGVAQGRTLPTTGGRSGPWDRTIEIVGLTGLHETCNLALTRERFVRLGGFPALSVVRRSMRGFGEDVLLGAAAAREAGAVFVTDAVVRHRWVPADYRAHLAARRRLVGFPLLLTRVPELRERMLHGVFFARRTAAVDLGLLGLGLAVLTRRWGPVVAAAPWVAFAAGDARHRPGRPLAVRVAQEMVADTVAAASLVEGSVRSRTPVL